MAAGIKVAPLSAEEAVAVEAAEVEEEVAVAEVVMAMQTMPSLPNNKRKSLATRTVSQVKSTMSSVSP